MSLQINHNSEWSSGKRLIWWNITLMSPLIATMCSQNWKSTPSMEGPKMGPGKRWSFSTCSLYWYEQLKTSLLCYCGGQVMRVVPWLSRGIYKVSISSHSLQFQAFVPLHNRSWLVWCRLQSVALYFEVVKDRQIWLLLDKDCPSVWEAV